MKVQKWFEPSINQKQLSTSCVHYHLHRIETVVVGEALVTALTGYWLPMQVTGMVIVQMVEVIGFDILL